MTTAVLDPRTDGELAVAIVAGHAELCAIQRRLLADVAEHDRRQAWRGHGATGEAKFLESALGVSWRTANAWVRVGHALDRRPAIGEHFADGTFSFDHVLGLVDVMAAEAANAVAPAGPFDDQAPTPEPHGEESPNGTLPDGHNPDGANAGDGANDNGDGPGGGDGGGESDAPLAGGGDGCGLGTGGGATDPEPGAADGPSDAELIDLANRMSPAQLASMARRLRQRSSDEAAAAHRRRRVAAWFDADSGQLRFNGNLFDLQSQNVWAALVDYSSTCKADPVTGKFDPLEVRFADAFDAMATAYLEGRSHMTHRPAVIVHADAAILDGHDGWAQTSTGTPLASETVRRLLCFCELTTVVNDKLGDPLRLGRTKRTPTWQLAEMVRRRDGGCRFPGCQRKLWIHTHHISEWDRDHGPTDYENLCDLCSFHHHLCHEGRWRIEGNACGELIFVDPTGTVRLSSWPNQARMSEPPVDRRGAPGDERPDRWRPPPDRAGSAVDAKNSATSAVLNGRPPVADGAGIRGLATDRPGLATATSPFGLATDAPGLATATSPFGLATDAPGLATATDPPGLATETIGLATEPLRLFADTGVPG